MKGWFKKISRSTDKRTRAIKRNVSGALCLRAFDTFFDFLLVPLSLAYLTQTNYGVWLTINAIINWTTFFDVGITHGLRNKLVIALSNNDYSLARAYTTSAYAALGAISLLLVFVGIIVIPLIEWSFILNFENENGIVELLLLVFISYSVRLVLNIITSVFFADQMPVYTNLVSTCSKLLIVIGIWVMTLFAKGDLLLFASIHSAAPILVLLCSTFFGFRGKYCRIRPRLSSFDFGLMRGLIVIGLNFFVLQLSAIVLFTTDNLIISHIFSPGAVVPFSICIKYFSIYLVLFSILSAPYWSAHTEAYTSGDTVWIRQAIKDLNRIWIYGLGVIAVMLVSFEWVKEFWISSELAIPFGLMLQATLFVSLQSYNMIYTQFINGVGKLRISLITSMITILFNIPMSIFFAKHLDFGLSGVLIATNICLVIYIITRRKQYNLIINNKAQGIWNK
ncbi:MATE family efflux transporter [Akkermansiaceae bacterium]|nr:MATE family efflux transporter [Akkermansiaceae bacterium]